jgi:hypothetical protein
MTSNHISVSMTKLIWREKHLWNTSELHKLAFQILHYLYFRQLCPKKILKKYFNCNTSLLVNLLY